MTEQKEITRPTIEVVGNCCCGCGACAATCPVSCLTMEPSELGFAHPVYEGGCIGCGMCGRACPVLSVGEADSAASIFWAKNIDSSERDRSSSGGLFALLAERVLSQSGVVYGAAFAEGCKSVHHIRISDSSELDAAMRSKYVQSTVDVAVYKSLETDLRQGLSVLFSGTSCQCAGIRNYLMEKKIPTDTLLLVEVICHGVPSPRLWTEWLESVSADAGAEVDEVNFRSKSTGWLTYSVAYYAATEKVRSMPNNQDWFMRAFLQNASLRQSCLECPTKRRCGSDLTLGDFWGIQDRHPEVADRLGVSAVICNTKKGQSALEAIREQLEIGASSMDEVLPGNPALVYSVEPHPKRHEFLADVASGMDIEDLRKKWAFKPSFRQKVHGKLAAIKHKVLG